MQEQSDRSIPASEAARILDVHPSRIRALAECGQIEGRKVAGRWMFDPSAVERRASAERLPGRALSPANAWALLFLASGLEAPWVRADVRSRLRRRIRSHAFRDYVGRLRRRAEARYYRADPPLLRRVEADRDFVRSGVSASGAYSVDVKAPGIVEGYLPRERLDDVVYRHALRAVDPRAANLIVRAPALWPFGESKVAPAAVVAVDLVEATDQRSRRAGIQMAKSVGLW